MKSSSKFRSCLFLPSKQRLSLLRLSESRVFPNDSSDTNQLKRKRLMLEYLSSSVTDSYARSDECSCTDLAPVRCTAL